MRGPEVDHRHATLVVDEPAGAGPVDGVVLVLHGGRATSNAATSPAQLAVARMLPFGAAVGRAAREQDLRVVVARLRFRVRGWNGRRRDPVTDATWALAELRERFGDAPIVLLGHSMGGRTAFALAGAPGVVGVVGLAPWVESDDTVGPLAGRHVDVLHGTADRMTSPQASRAWTERAEQRGAITSYTPVEGAGHPMLKRADWWHRTAAAAAIGQIVSAAGRDAAGATRQDVTGSSVRWLGTNDLRSTTGSRRQS